LIAAVCGIALNASAQDRPGGRAPEALTQIVSAGEPSPVAAEAPADPGKAPDPGDPRDSADHEHDASSEQQSEAAPASAQDPAPDVDELRRRVDLLAAEVERLRSGEEPQAGLSADAARAIGLAPSAAATYGRGEGVSIAGYGEMLYENFAPETESGAPIARGTQFDFLRAILYAGYRFNDRFLFNSEIEIEHTDEVFVEFAYVDYQAHEHIGVRGGLLLMPMGLVNEFHEPTVFLGAERPVTENRIIPSTWRENGGGVYGSFDRVAFRAYVVNGFNGASFSSNGVRGGRQKGGKAKASNMAFTGRLDITPTPGVFVGASVYAGGSGQGDIIVDGRDVSVRTTIVDLHGQAQVRGLDVRGLYARAYINEAAELNRARGLTGSSGVAERMQGAYVQVGYDLLSQTVSAGGVALTPYVRYELVDTQDKMPSGFTRSLDTDNTFMTLGVELKPIPNVVVKVDHAWVQNDADSGVNQFNLSMGYAF